MTRLHGESLHERRHDDGDPAQYDATLCTCTNLDVYDDATQLVADVEYILCNGSITGWTSTDVDNIADEAASNAWSLRYSDDAGLQECIDTASEKEPRLLGNAEDFSERCSSASDICGDGASVYYEIDGRSYFDEFIEKFAEWLYFVEIDSEGNVDEAGVNEAMEKAEEECAEMAAAGTLEFDDGRGRIIKHSEKYAGNHDLLRSELDKMNSGEKDLYEVDGRSYYEAFLDQAVLAFLPLGIDDNGKSDVDEMDAALREADEVCLKAADAGTLKFDDEKVTA